MVLKKFIFFVKNKFVFSEKNLRDLFLFKKNSFLKIKLKFTIFAWDIRLENISKSRKT